uniref:SH3 domain-containing protein n=1 Tax=Nannospalax galili TaxID=1026970 RepID=A0A8C6RJL3_NANGA
MYRALYAFRSAEPNAMAFAAGETFLVLERSSAHWWLAARARSGETGYVPPAYLHRLQVSVPSRHGHPGPRDRTPSQAHRADPGNGQISSRLEAGASNRQGV